MNGLQPITGGGGHVNPFVLSSPLFHLVGAGTMANNGAFTLTTAFSAPMPLACWNYFSAGAIYAGSAAGWYWGVWSSTTACTVYANTYTSGLPTAPVSPTPIVNTGPGAYAGGPASTNVPSLVVTIPAASLTAVSQILTEHRVYGATGTTGSCRMTFNATNCGLINASTLPAPYRWGVKATGDLTKCVGYDNINSSAYIGPVDGSAGVTITMNMNLSAANGVSLLHDLLSILITS